MSNLGEYLKELDIKWRNAKTEKPTEIGFYIVAIFGEDGELKEFSTDYISGFRGRAELEYNGSGRHLTDYPTHFISFSEFKQLLSLIPRENKNGDLEI